MSPDFKLSIATFIAFFLDEISTNLDKDKFSEIELNKILDDPLKFNDKKKYIDRLKEYRKKTNRNDAFILGKGDINQKNAIFGFMNFNFIW